MPEFDVFLSYNREDRSEVIKIAQQLKQRHLKPWLDVWELPPGQSWQDLLEEQIEQIKSAAVFVGSSGFGPWQEVEMRAFIREFIKRRCPVIPVLLENAPQEPALPILLQDLTWVDFRHAESNPMGRLIWGITQIKPDNFDSFQVTDVEPLKPVPEVKSKFQRFTEDLGNGVELEMIAIPGGKFLMGSPEGEGDDSEKPQHEVAVQSFYMGKFLITQAQYQQVMGKNPSHFQGDERPVECVSWDDAVEFCQKLSKQTGKGYRLPSEAEWEYAARAGTNTKYSFGDDISGKLANYGGNIGETTSVDQYEANSFGLFDMHGNVWEWCQDDWHDNYKNAPTNGQAWFSEKENTKVIRGGSWYDDPDICRSACRNLSTRGYRSSNIGFRVVCVAPGTT
ncbi:MAG: SUMF1/EgtB/PvdO family nonheme iron enzyme [Xenococcus sp. MO_188.B8]|nr:SUMF1/EgtB/PvdO family nonheme iron enzyme [Xenococcus sp. MO_188.B8]